MAAPLMLFGTGIYLLLRGGALVRSKPNDSGVLLIARALVATGFLAFASCLITLPGIPDEIIAVTLIFFGIVTMLIVVALGLLFMLALICAVLFVQEVWTGKGKYHVFVQLSRSIQEKTKRKPKEKRKNEWA